MNESKVEFNLHNVHYAPLTITAGVPTFEAPVPIPGAVSLALSANGELTKFYADGVTYWQGNQNNGYEGDLEIARVPDQMYMDIWGHTMDETAKVLVENSAAKEKPFAMLFQIDGDENDALYVLYNVAAGRPGIESKTHEASKTPNTAKISVSCAPLPNGDIRARSTKDTPKAVLENWFKSVYQRAAAKTE